MKDNIYKRYLLIFLIGIAVRIVLAIFVPVDLFPDSISYINFAKFLLDGHASEGSFNNTMPGYPLILYLSKKFFFSYHTIDIFLSCLTIIVAGELFYHIFNDRNGAILCAFFFAIYPFNVFYSYAILTESAYVFFNFLGFLMFYRNKHIWGCIFIALSILIRPTIDFLNILIIIAFSFFVFKENLITIFKKVLIFIAIYSAFLIPWWSYNFEKHGEFIRLNLGFSTVLYAGNNPMNKSGGGNIYEDYNLDILKDEKNSILNAKTLQKSAIEYIVNNPIVFIKNGFKKIFRLFNIFPNYKKTDLALSKKMISFVSGTTISILYILSIASFFLITKKQAVKLVPLFLYFLIIVGVHAITIASIRYRFPLEFILLILASFSANKILNKYKIEIYK